MKIIATVTPLLTTVGATPSDQTLASASASLAEPP